MYKICPQKGWVVRPPPPRPPLSYAPDLSWYPDFCNFHVDFKIIPCPVSILRNSLWRVTYVFPHVARVHVACRF